VPKRGTEKSRFTLTPAESRALIVLALLLVLGVVAGQLRRQLEADSTGLVIQNLKTVVPDTTQVVLNDVNYDSSSVAKVAPEGVISTPKVVSSTPATSEVEISAKTGAEQGERVNLNTATVQQLIALPGIGPVLANRILEWREQHGSFRTVDDLQLVMGIGEKKMITLRPLVTVER